MAVITKTNAQANAPVTVNATTLGASDTFVYDASKAVSLLILRNATAGSLSPVITGSAAVAPYVPGYGTASVAGGYTGFGAIAAGATKVLDLKAADVWLKGTITVTSGSGIIANLVEY
jgi:hypothetical protein